VTGGKGTAVTSIGILGVGILICLKTVVGQGKRNGTGCKIITPAPDVADFKGKSSTAKHVVQIANQKISLSSRVGGFCDKPL